MLSRSLPRFLLQAGLLIGVAAIAAVLPPVVERRRWNVFDLQNRPRSIAGTDPARDEILLLYLREFADVAGDLSEDFDGFVRESFPELIASG